MSLTCTEIRDTYSGRDIRAMATIQNVADEAAFCNTVDGFSDAAKAAVTASSQGVYSRGREISTFLRYIRNNPPLFVALNPTAVQTLQAQFTDTGADVEDAFWYGLLVGPCMSQGFSFASHAINLPDDLGTHDSTLKEHWTWLWAFDNGQTLMIRLERRTPNAPFSWLPDVAQSRSLYKFLVSDLQDVTNGAPTVPGGTGMVQIDASPFNVVVGAAFVLESVATENVTWNIRLRQPGMTVDVTCEGSSDQYVRLGPETFGHFSLQTTGTWGGAAVVGKGLFLHGWTSSQDQDGFQVGYFTRAVTVFPKRNNPGSGMTPQSTWVVTLAENSVLFVDVHSSYEFATWYSTTGQFIQGGMKYEVAIDFQVADAANSLLTTTPYGTTVTLKDHHGTWTLVGTTESVVHTDNLFWDSNQVWEYRAQRVRWTGTFIKEDFSDTSGVRTGWWTETSRQSPTSLRLAVESVCRVDNGGNEQLFAWPKPSAGQATAVFFLFLSPFILVGLLLFAILFGWKLGKSRHASET